MQVWPSPASGLQQDPIGKNPLARFTGLEQRPLLFGTAISKGRYSPEREPRLPFFKPGAKPPVVRHFGYSYKPCQCGSHLRAEFTTIRRFLYLFCLAALAVCAAALA